MPKSMRQLTVNPFEDQSRLSKLNLVAGSRSIQVVLNAVGLRSI